MLNGERRGRPRLGHLGLDLPEDPLGQRVKRLIDQVRDAPVLVRRAHDADKRRDGATPFAPRALNRLDLVNERLHEERRVA